MFKGECVGDFYADVFVEDKVIVELKAVRAIAVEHEAQIINYLNATGIEVGLLINFGSYKFQIKKYALRQAGEACLSTGLASLLFDFFAFSAFFCG